MALPFEGLRKTMRTIQNDFIVEVVQAIVEKNSNKIVELNTEKQLFDKGIDSDGDSLGVYSNSYKALKKSLNMPYDRVTLRFSGDFHKSFKIIIGKKEFEITATDWKLGILMQKYGERILGLTNSNVVVFQEMVIRPELLKEIRKKIKL